MKESIDRVSMIDYDQVKQMANFAYLSPHGQSGKVWIHKSTFDKLMNGKWDDSEYGEPSLFQRDLKTAVLSQVKKNFTEWFDVESNNLLTEATKRGGLK